MSAISQGWEDTAQVLRVPTVCCLEDKQGGVSKSGLDIVLCLTQNLALDALELAVKLSVTLNF